MGYYMVIYLARPAGLQPDLNEARRAGRCKPLAAVLAHHPAAAAPPPPSLWSSCSPSPASRSYDQMYMITQGGPGTATMTLVYYIYNVAFVNTPKYGYASAISMVLFGTGADRYHHPVPRLQGRELRKEEELCLLLLSRPKPLRTPQFHLQVPDLFLPHRHHSLYAAALFVDAVLLL